MPDLTPLEPVARAIAIIMVLIMASDFSRGRTGFGRLLSTVSIAAGVVIFGAVI